MASCFFCERAPAPSFTLTSLQGDPHDTRPGAVTMAAMRGWAIWGATVAIMLLLNGVAWTLVIAY